MTTRPIVVIGAGLAGLSAAFELHHAGQPVIVLEARSRVGGRVLTFRDFSDGRIAEAGGELINSDHYRMKRLAEQSGLELETVPGMDEWFSWLALEGKLGAADDFSVWASGWMKKSPKLTRHCRSWAGESVNRPIHSKRQMRPN